MAATHISGPLVVGGSTLASTDIDLINAIAVDGTEIDQRVLNMQLTLGTADDQHVVIPFACNVTAVYCVIDRALTTADETLTLKNNAGTGMTGGVITITQSGSADGDIDSVTPSANNSFTAGQKMTVSIGGENGTAAIANLTIVVDIT